MSGVFAVACLASPFLAVPAMAIDCAKAKSPVDKALCADPAAKASDEAMAAAFNALRSAQPEDAKAATLADQRAWLTLRGEVCPTPDMPLTRCLTRENEQRAAILSGRPETGPGATRHPRPVFLRQAAGPDAVEVAVRVYRFPEPQGPAETALNAIADAALSAVIFKKSDPEPAVNASHSEEWTIRYASPAFVSIERTTYAFGGGAHGSGETTGINLNLSAGRVATIGDYFDGAAVAEIAKACLTQVRAQKKERGADAGDAAALRKGVSAIAGALDSWIVKADGVRIVFNTSSIGAYAESEYECTLPAARLTALSGRAFPPL